MNIDNLLQSAPKDLSDPQLHLWLERVRIFSKQCGDRDMDWLISSLKVAKTADHFAAVEKFDELKAKLAVLSENDSQQVGRSDEHRRYNLRLHGDVEMNVSRDPNRVFLVHGHNENMRLKVKDFLQCSLGYKVIVLDDVPNKGRTIIQKLCEEIKDCGKAIVLYSADDRMADGCMRARQNVVFEHGLLYNLLGTQNVISLAEDKIEWPSDLSGVVYIPYNDDWKERVRREWGTAGN